MKKTIHLRDALTRPRREIASPDRAAQPSGGPGDGSCTGITVAVVNVRSLGWDVRMPYFPRLIESRRARRVSDLDVPELLATRSRVFSELARAAFLDEFDVEVCEVHGIVFSKGEACPGCGVFGNPGTNQRKGIR